MPTKAATQSRPIIPWMGGKRRLAKHLLPLFPDHSCYIELFAGGAALFFMRETPAKVEVLNDINGDLINLYRVLQHHYDEFMRQFAWTLTSRQTFTLLQSTPPETLTDIQRAARFYYLQHTAFGGKTTRQSFGTSTTARHGALPALLKICGQHGADWTACISKTNPGTAASNATTARTASSTLTRPTGNAKATAGHSAGNNTNCWPK